MLRGLVFCCFAFTASLAHAGEKPSAADAIAQMFAGPREMATPPEAGVPKAKSAYVKPAATSKPHTKPPVLADATPSAAGGKVERPPLDYEMEMLRQARAEHAAVMNSTAAPAAAIAVVPPEKPRIAEHTTLNALPFAGAPIAAAAEMNSGTPPAFPAAADPILAPSQPVAKIAESAALPAPAKAPDVTVPPAPAKVEAAAAAAAKIETNNVEAAKPADTTLALSPHASLLVTLETSGTSNKSAAPPTYDPLICLGDSCYVSAGLNAAAVKLAKTDALKLKTTSEASPDSCKGKVGCVFRDVAVPAGALVQVVELGSATQSSVQPVQIQLDTSCKAADGDLNCDSPILTTDFRLWVVPEETARSAGVPAIEEAVADGLPHLDVARATDK